MASGHDWCVMEGAWSWPDVFEPGTIGRMTEPTPRTVAYCDMAQLVVEENGMMTTGEMATELDISREDAYRYLRRLETDGKVLKLAIDGWRTVGWIATS